MNRSSRVLLLLSVGLVAGSGLFLAGRALAGGTPTTAPVLTYSGALTSADGTPLSGNQIVEVRLWDNDTAQGSPLCTSNAKTITPDSAGRFSVALDACEADIKANPDTWLEVLLETDGLSTSLGLSKVGAVPYAIEAGHATTADDAASAASAASATGALYTRITTVEDTANGLPSLVGVVAASAERTGAVSPNATNWTAIPGLTVTFTLTQDSLVQAVADGVQRTTDNAAGTFCHAGYRYVVDGTPKGDASFGQRLQVSNGATNWHSIWSMVDFNSLAPGQHTISIEVKTSPGACYVCGESNGALADYTNCTLNVTAVPN